MREDPGSNPGAARTVDDRPPLVSQGWGGLPHSATALRRRRSPPEKRYAQPVWDVKKMFLLKVSHTQQLSNHLIMLKYAYRLREYMYSDPTYYW